MIDSGLNTQTSAVYFVVYSPGLDAFFWISPIGGTTLGFRFIVPTTRLSYTTTNCSGDAYAFAGENPHPVSRKIVFDLGNGGVLWKADMNNPQSLTFNSNGLTSSSTCNRYSTPLSSTGYPLVKATNLPFQYPITKDLNIVYK